MPFTFKSSRHAPRAVHALVCSRAIHRTFSLTANSLFVGATSRSRYLMSMRISSVNSIEPIVLKSSRHAPRAVHALVCSRAIHRTFSLTANSLFVGATSRSRYLLLGVFLLGVFAWVFPQFPQFPQFPPPTGELNPIFIFP